MDLLQIPYSVDYTWMKTKDDSNKQYDLVNQVTKKMYFTQKVGNEIEKLKEFLKNNTFIAYFMSPKMAGKGTYIGVLKEIIGEEYFAQISVGDLVRDADNEYTQNGKDSDLYKYVSQNYRGLSTIDELFDTLVNRSTEKVSLPTDFILLLVKRAIDKIGHKTIFLDGFPRTIDQISYSLYLRDLINYRNDPDLFIFINLPTTLIDLRIKGRLVCPKCGNSLNKNLLPSSIIEYDNQSEEIIFRCDKPFCTKEKLISKEGDNLGIKAIETRIKDDLELMNMARKLYGIPKIELFNSLEFEETNKYVDTYELTQEYSFSWNGEEIVKSEKPLILEQNGKKYHSLLPPPVVVQLIKQLANIFEL